MSKFNFFQEVLVSTTTFTDAAVSWDFISAGIMLLNENTTSGRIVDYSFDGENVHGRLDPDTDARSLAFDNRHESAVYFRLKTAGAACVVRVEAWA